MIFKVDLVDNSIVEIESENNDVQKEEEKDKLLNYYFPSSKDETKNVQENKKKKWNPKRWKVEYEKIVMMDLMGLKGYEIAEKLNITPQHVYNILGTDEAQSIQRALSNKIRNESFDITKELKEIQELTVKRLKKCLKEDDIFKESKLGFISKGIDVMKGTGEYLKNAPSVSINNQFSIPPSVADRFIKGLEKSDQVRLLLSGKNIEDVEDVSSK